MEANKTLLILAIIVVVISIVNVSVTFLKVSDFKEQITGYASGYINVTIQSQIIVNVSRASINWSSGTVNPGETNANIFTHAETAESLRGNWTTSVGGMVIENVGNVNCSIDLQSNESAATLIGGTDPGFQWNITVKDVDSCDNGAGPALSTWWDVNSSEAQEFCDQFGYITASNEVYLDINLTIPYDATMNGARFSTITITADAAGD